MIYDSAKTHSLEAERDQFVAKLQQLEVCRQS